MMNLRHLFPELTKHQALQEALEHDCTLRFFPTGDVILREGEYVRFVPLLLSGLVKVYREDEEGNELLLYYIKPGESCIMTATACLQDESSRIKAVIEEPADILLIPSGKAQEYNRTFSGWNSFFYSLFTSKYEELLHVISILTFSNKDVRLLDYLHKKADVTGKKIISTTHQQIADDLGATREVISRLLKKLEKDGKLELGHGRVRLL